MVTCGSQKFIGRGAAKIPFFSEESQGLCLCFIPPFDPVRFQLGKKLGTRCTLEPASLNRKSQFKTQGNEILTREMKSSP